MSGRAARVTIGVLALAGLGISIYLTWIHYSGDRPLCLAGGGCEKVQSSSYSRLAGVPVALLGIGGYGAILGSLWVRGEAGRMITAMLALVGLGFSGYLTYAELFRIHAVCQWCVASAAIMTVIAGLAIVRAWLGPPPETVGAALRH